MSEGQVLKEELPKFLPAKEMKIGGEAKECIMVYDADASPGHFFVLPIESAAQVDEIANALAPFRLPGSKVLVENPSVGVACIAKCAGAFDRARISAQLPGNRFTVQFVDFGNTEDVAANEIYAIPTVLLATPPLAIGCALHGVETWSEKKAAEFKKLIDKERTFHVTFVARRDGTAEGEIEYEVKMAVPGKAGLINDRMGESAADEEETVVTDATDEETSDAAVADLEENGKAGGTISLISALPTGVNSDEFSVASADQPVVPLTCDIDRLADADLAKIFKYLPAVDRLLVSEVYKRWHAITKQAWLDITHLDLSPIPGPNIAPIISLCPNLRQVSALRKTFDLNELRILSRICLSWLKLRGCYFANLPDAAVVRRDPVSAIFSNSLRNAAWDELVLDELMLEFIGSTDDFLGMVKFPASFPASLRRLQVSYDSWLPLGDDPFYNDRRCLRGIDQLRDLECLILLSGRKDVPVWCALTHPRLLASLANLQSLRELALGSKHGWGRANCNLALPLLGLTRLETLFLDNFIYLDDGGENFDKLVTKHPALRILILTGRVGRFCFEDVQFPARLRYGNGFSATPLPQLHIFVGKATSEKILFPRFPSDAAKVYPISEPLPQFLEREDIKPIFEGVWIAAQIKEAAKLGKEFCDYEHDLTTSFRSIDN